MRDETEPTVDGSAVESMLETTDASATGSMLETADGSRTLASARFGETYHSVHGAVAESRHVFVELSGAGERLRRGERVRVLEVGFGTGLNLVTSAVEARVPGALLDYTAFELHPLAWEEVEPLGYQALLPETWRGGLANAVRGLHPAAVGGEWQGVLGGEGAEVRMRLRRRDITGAAGRLSGGKDGGFDVVYHDAFSPGACPELWTGSFFSMLGGAVCAGAVLATYSCAGRVRRALQEAGWVPEKRPGPPDGKREVLRAVWGG